VLAGIPTENHLFSDAQPHRDGQDWYARQGISSRDSRTAQRPLAGREIRVIVDPKSINDENAWRIARDIAKKVEEELTYPGEVKVTLLREVRCIEYAR